VASGEDSSCEPISMTAGAKIFSLEARIEGVWEQLRRERHGRAKMEDRIEDLEESMMALKEELQRHRRGTYRQCVALGERIEGVEERCREGKG
jgi:septal ring factor EnvC (AmiA/AmiB activator)